jgi:hypothetical protein
MFKFKTAVLALALAAPAAAKGKAVARDAARRLDYFSMTVGWSVNDGVIYPVSQTNKPQIKDIQCGTTQKLTFHIQHNPMDFDTGVVEDGDVQFTLFDQEKFNTDETNPVVVSETKPLGNNEKKTIDLLFTCGKANPNFNDPDCVEDCEDTCLLDMTYNGGHTSNFEGEKASWARMHANFTYEFEGETVDSMDTENIFFFVGCDTTPTVIDDPHFRTWNNRWYDYMGECDLTFIDAPNFSEDAAMRINIRTKARYDYSFIESAVIQIGDDTMEVGAWGEYFINGVEGARLPKTLAGYQVTRVVESEKITRIYVHIADDETIEFKTYKDWVSVMFHGPSHFRYNGATGMLGSHDHHGKLLGRDGKTLFTDMEAFGQEWQVQAHEDMLFHSVRLPQAPEKCVLPAPVQEQRRLGESLAAEAAEAACRKAGWSVSTIEMCIHDVMATGDLELASAGAM